MLLLVLFGALFVNLNVIQLVRSDELATHPANRRLLIREYQIQRGPIVAGEKEIAHSEPTDDTLKYLRIYENPLLWSHITGYYSFVVGRSALEESMNEALIGTPTEVLAQNLAELLGARDDLGNTVRITVDPRVQAVAADALGDRVGAVVALDPKTGGVLALHSNPGYDPNRLAQHDASAILDAWEELQTADQQPLLNRATRTLYPPGSTFKIIVAAAALERGLTPETALPDEATYDVPQTDADIGNFSPGPCTGGGTISLADALRVSCNTAFARLGVELGAGAIVEQANRFGWGREAPLELPVVESTIPPPEELDVPATAQSAIGQRDVRATPLQIAMVSAAIANEGVLMKPHIVAEVLDPAGRTVRGPQVGQWSERGMSSQAVSPRTARQLSEMMVDVVQSGTGRAAQIAGHRVGGKTGTAQVPDQSPTVWFTGFADDTVAVAVVLPDAGGDATGGGDAAPIAQAVMEAVLGIR